MKRIAYFNGFSCVSRTEEDETCLWYRAGERARDKRNNKLDSIAQMQTNEVDIVPNAPFANAIVNFYFVFVQKYTKCAAA